MKIFNSKELTGILEILREHKFLQIQKYLAMKALLFFIGLFFTVQAYSQNASIHGKITDQELGDELIYANLMITKNKKYIKGGSTDFEGNYSIPIDPGVYELSVSYTGYANQVITGVVIKEGQNLKLDIELKQSNDYIPFTHECGLPLIPLILHDETSSGHTMESEEIRNMSTKNIKQFLLNTPGVSLGNF